MVAGEIPNSRTVIITKVSETEINDDILGTLTVKEPLIKVRPGDYQPAVVNWTNVEVTECVQ